VQPEKEVLGNVDLDIYDDTAVSNMCDSNNELTIHDDKDADADFRCEDIVDDVSVSESVEELLNDLL